jgi:hypothetical protein
MQSCLCHSMKEMIIYAGFKKKKLFYAALIWLPSIACGLKASDYVPDCAQPGVHYGASIGAVAGGLSGAAALTGTGKAIGIN